MTLVILVLAAVWAAVLIPPALRHRAERSPGDTIKAFKRQQSVLRRTSPRGHQSSMGDHWSRQPAPIAPLAPPLAPLSRHNAPAARSPRGPRALTTQPAWAGTRSAATISARRRTLRRRRDILAALAVAAISTLALGALPPLRMFWTAHLVFDVLLVAYVTLLVRQRNAAAEREMKVRFLPGPVSLEPAMVRQEPMLLRRSAN